MISLRKPTADTIRAFLDSQSKLDLSYPAVGATATGPPAGYTVDHTRIRLGDGEPVFEAARAALRRWEQFNLGWVWAWSPDESIKVGTVVGVCGRFMGLWWLNACRVVYLVDETDGPVWKFGFAYGTLPEHAESGEERFLIEWDRKGGGVWYDLLAFSRPQQFLTRLGHPWVRRLQKRFARDSGRAMLAAAGGSRSGDEM